MRVGPKPVPGLCGCERMAQIGLGSQILQYCLTGATIGAVYSMVALGFNTIYNVTGIINFAQGEFVMLGGLVMVFFRAVLKIPFPLALIATVSLVTCVGLLLDRFAIRPLRNPSVITMIIATIAASILIKGAAMFAWGKDPYDLQAFSGRNPITFLQVAVQPQSLWVLGILLAVVVLMTLFFDRTILGKAMRACADNRDVASLVGININRMILLSFAISSAIGAIAGIVITPISLLEYDRGAMLALKGFAAVVLGGLGNFAGAVVGGLIIGLIESLGAGLVSSAYKDAFALLLLLVLLFVKPSGLLGSAEASRLRRF